ncbi:MAG: hypothetical protein QGH46_01360 [Gammaproteobacteria bacterium]|jgi:pimeloyl-ACP methyl ester carboxylesterase|nr:hypothetical protein [Gammaproteobacteria bacterium]MDP7092842.1 hypothetical protein [Gammaproteobacteria bacterium]MDP7271293.1 hypothetical protein [Gammaproteobacteria bacterium]HJP04210.1 hypothetical protein [Gammaproteobacteria bacterium]
MHKLPRIHRVAWQVLWLVPLIAFSGITLASDVIFDSTSILVDGDRELPLRVAYAAGNEPSPVIILSHGTFSAGTRYDPVAQHWAANGYIVILPSHRDANYAETPKSEAHMLEIIDSRARDVIAIADQLNGIAEKLPGIKNRMDATRLVSAGHSVGTQTALLMTGLRIRNPQTGKIKDVDENRFSATVLLSDPGKMALMPEDLWLGGSRPVFMATGPEDYGLMGDGRRPATYQNEVLEPESPVRGKHYLLSVDGLDHQFGGLIHRQKADGTPDYEAMEVFLELSTAFLDFYLRDDESAAKLLEPRTVSDRATLSIQ